jgi:hypothetical protein
MAGILDNKSRVLDAYVTQEGRRQIAQGELRIRYVTFSDADVYYGADAVAGAADVTDRVYLEPSNLPQDQIVFEADDSGRLKPFKALSDLALAAGQLTLRTVEDAADVSTVVSGPVFAAAVKEVLASSIDNFEKLRVIGSYDALFGEKDFSVGPEKVGFTLTDDGPISDTKNFSAQLSDMQSLFNDKRLSQVDNFAYLQPVNRASEGVDTTNIGNYPPWSTPVSYSDAHAALAKELLALENVGYMKSVSFDPTSVDNDLVGQVFEVGHGSVSKLDVLHFGKALSRDVFFVGKVVVDDNDTQSFVHIFTLVFE